MNVSPSSYETPDPFRTPSSAPTKAGEPTNPGTPAGTSKTLSYTTTEKNWAMAAHLAPLTGFVVPVPFFNIIAPAIVWFIQRESMPLVDDQGKESLNFQITMMIAGVVCFILAFVFIGFFLGIALLIYDIVMMVLAAKSVQEGRPYRYPFTLRLL